VTPPAAPVADSHPSAELMAGYVDRQLPPAEQSAIEQHLLGCSQCRQEYGAVRRLVRTPVPAWGRWAGALATAALLTLVIWGSAGRSRDAVHVREPARDAASVPRLQEPRGTVLTARRLIWQPVPNALSYRLTVFDSVGRAVFESETPDTVEIVPDSVRFTPGQSYFWKVEAQAEWGRWAPSALTPFVVKPVP